MFEMPIILLANHYDETSFSVLEKVTPARFELKQLDKSTKENLLKKVVDADYMIVSGRLPIDQEVISAAKKLKMISRTGVGLDTIGLGELNRRGIPLYVNKGINAESVAEFSLLLILASLRRFVEIDERTKSGKWDKREFGIKTNSLKGKLVYIVGMGAIGRRLSELLVPFGCFVKSSNKVSSDRLPDEMLQADIISLHCPLCRETEHLINEASLSRMKPGVILINTARGGLINELDLAKALRSGQVSFAALDVRENEPSYSAHPFDGLKNVILTSHVAGTTAESFESMMQRAVNNIVEFDLGNTACIEEYLWKDSTHECNR